MKIEAAKEKMERELMKELEKRREERILQEKYREVFKFANFDHKSSLLCILDKNYCAFSLIMYGKLIIL